MNFHLFTYRVPVSLFDGLNTRVKTLESKRPTPTSTDDGKSRVPKELEGRVELLERQVRNLQDKKRRPGGGKGGKGEKGDKGSDEE